MIERDVRVFYWPITTPFYGWGKIAQAKTIVLPLPYYVISCRTFLTDIRCNFIDGLAFWDTVRYPFLDTFDEVFANLARSHYGPI